VTWPKRSPGSRTEAAAAAGLALAALLLGARGDARGTENPHAFMADPARCTECHEKTPVQGFDDFTSVTFTAPIVEVCTRCHAGEHLREEHPVEVRPEYPVPEDLHLDDNYSVTCATCHDAHGGHEAGRPFLPRTFWERLRDDLGGRTSWPTRFLRRSNSGGELCLACHKGGIVAPEGDAPQLALEEYAGSEACRECHPAIWEEWRRTLHARNFRDAKKEPGAVRAAFAGAPGVEGLELAREDVLWTVGEHWTQRYLVAGRKEGELAVVPDTWSLQAGAWMREGSFSRSWMKYCAGCHLTALNPFTGVYLEEGTGCEGCHGPGRRHAESADQAEIVNPALLVASRRDMICEGCHTAGHDRSGGFRYPVGYVPGQDLMRYYRGLVPKPGQDTANYRGDGTYEDRHRQFEFWVSRVDILSGMTCDVCSADRQAAAEYEGRSAEYRLTPDEVCATCHREVARGLREHSGHAPAVAGCVDCHRPALVASRTAYSVHDHKFRFGTPRAEDIAGGDPCQGCHERRGVRRQAALEARYPVAEAQR
jgi:hypothetical protein